MLSAAKGTDLYLFVLLSLSLGTRRGELSALKWENIDFEKRTIKVCESRVQANKTVIEKDPKSEAGNRTITVGSDVITELRKAKEPWFRDLDYVICKEDGTPYRPDSLTQKWERFTERNKLPHIKLHGLRHTNATTMVAAGVNTVVVKNRLGHSDVATTMRYYVHALPEMDQEAAEKIDNILFD